MKSFVSLTCSQFCFVFHHFVFMFRLLPLFCWSPWPPSSVAELVDTVSVVASVVVVLASVMAVSAMAVLVTAMVVPSLPKVQTFSSVATPWPLDPSPVHVSCPFNLNYRILKLIFHFSGPRSVQDFIPSWKVYLLNRALWKSSHKFHHSHHCQQQHDQPHQVNFQKV